ncbi:MAG: signal peptide peptidase SppA [Egibacteraceae bacterium]
MTDRSRRGFRLARMALIALAACSLVLGIVAAIAGFTERIDERSVFLLRAAIVAAGLLAAAGVCGMLARRVPRGTFLELDLTEPLVEQAGQAPFGALPGIRSRPTMQETVETLERAAGDPRIDGLVAWIRQPAKGLASTQELRDAVAAFRKAGKRTVAHAETFGESEGSNGAYYLATAFDEIWLQPSGDVGLVGLAMEVDFLRGALDKLGIDPQIDHRHEYKAAKNRITETAFTPPHRESSQRVVESLFDLVVTGVAASRDLRPAEVRMLIDSGPVPAPEAVRAGLVDRLAYRDELVERLPTRLLAVPAYVKRLGGRRRGATGIAVIHGIGQILQGRSRPGLLTRQTMGSDTVTAAFRAAVRNRRVKAILFRVDSPGGSAVASDAIRRAVAQAREAGKPVVVSMGDVAGSGGYYVAVDADRIIAHAATITGSIGVVGGKAVTAGLKAKLGISHDEVHVGEHALIASMNTPYSASEWQHVQRALDRTYDDFVGKVAAGRGLPIERVHEIAKGRIWSGADARELGLVDELGGYQAALQQLRRLLDLPADAPVRLIAYPPRRGPLARVLGRDGQAELARLRDMLTPAAGLVRELTGRQALEMPEVPLRRW